MNIVSFIIEAFTGLVLGLLVAGLAASSRDYLDEFPIKLK